MKRIAVLALQGAFAEHRRMLGRLGVESYEVRQLADWRKAKDGLIIPGGESTVMLKLLDELSLTNAIREDIIAGLPVFGTCAGLILLAKRVEDDNIRRISTMNIHVCRNSYGRQLGSFFTESDMVSVPHPIPMTFIRAPHIVSAGKGVEVLASVDGRIVAAREGNQLVTAFHPELNEDTSVHEMFIRMAG